MKVKELLATTLIVSLSFGSLPARAQENRAVVSRAELESALTRSLEADQADRQAIRNLLRRSEVKEMASEFGLDLRRAQNAVATLEGRDLQETAARARLAAEGLSGGAQTIQISVVTLLLIIIIVILLAD